MFYLKQTALPIMFKIAKSLFLFHSHDLFIILITLMSVNIRFMNIFNSSISKSCVIKKYSIHDFSINE